MNVVTENPDIGLPNVTVPSGEVIVDLSSLISQTSSRTALLIANQKIEFPSSTFQTFVESSNIIVCADGGANRLYQFNSQIIPHFIVGDLDSLSEKVKNYYEAKGSKIIEQSSQYATDFQKSVALIDLYFKYSHSLAEFENKLNLIDTEKELLNWNSSILYTENESIIIKCIGATGGRFDHSLQSLAQLHRYHLKNPYFTFLFLNTQDLIFYLPKGKHYLKYNNKKDQITHFKGNTCGLLPIYQEVTISSHGLKWDIKNWKSSMLGKISSSNRILNTIDRILYIEIDGPLAVNIETVL